MQRLAPTNSTLSLNGGGSGGIGAFATKESAGIVAAISGDLRREISPPLKEQENKFAHSASFDLLELACTVEKLKCTLFG